MFVQSWTPSSVEVTRHRKTSWGSGRSRGAESFFRWSAVSTTWVAVLLGFGLLLRRLAGAFDHPISGTTLLLGGLAALAMTWLLRSALAAVAVDDRPLWQQASWWLPGVALLMGGLAVSLPGTPGLVLFWMLLVAGESISLWGTIRHDMPGNRSAILLPGTDAILRDADWPKTMRLTSDAVPHVTLDDIDQGTIGEDVWQHLTRIRDSSQRETLVGLLRGEAVAGQQALSLHVAFCPPFAAVPEVYVQQLEGKEADLHVAEVMAYGARIEVRWRRQCEIPQRVLVQLMAGTPEDTDRQDSYPT